MNILAAIFGSTKNTERLTGGIVDGIDKAWFTKEEAGEWFLRYLEASQPQNLARRLIAIGVVGLWIMLVLTATVAWLFSEPFAFFVFDVIRDNVNMPFGIIIAFYFAAHVVRSVQGGK